jgi:hypothetical protein
MLLEATRSCIPRNWGELAGPLPLDEELIGGLAVSVG